MVFRRTRGRNESGRDRFEEVMALYRSGRLEQAIAGFGVILEAEPNTPVVLYYRGLAFVRLGELDRAIEDFRGVVSYGTDPRMVIDGHYNLALAYEREGRFEEAVDEYARAIAMNPEMEVAYCNRGGLLGRLARYEEALADLDLAVELDPADALAHWNRALIHQALDRPDDVVRDLEAYLKLAEPGDPHRTLAERVVKEVRSGGTPPRLVAQEREEVLNLVQQTIQANNEGRFEGALELADAGLKLAPWIDTLWDERAYALGSLGRLDEALECAEQGIRMCAGSARLQHTLATLLDDRGRRREALVAYRRYVKVAPPEYAEIVEKTKGRISLLERELGGNAAPSPTLD